MECHSIFNFNKYTLCFVMTLDSASVLVFEGKSQQENLQIPSEIGKVDKNSFGVFDKKMFISGDSGFVEFNQKFEKTRLTLSRFRLLFLGEQHNNRVFLFEEKLENNEKFLLQNYTKPMVYMSKADLEKTIQGDPKEISCSDSGNFICISSNKRHYFIEDLTKNVIAEEKKRVRHE